MMKRVSGAAVLFLMTVLLFILMRPKPPKASEQVQPGNGLEAPAATTTPPETSASPEAVRENSDAVRSPATQQTDNVPPPNSPIPASRVQVPSEPPKEEQAALEQELENVQFIVRGFRDALGENPVGNNAEITRALMGDNTKQVKMPLPGGSSLNEKGELTDRWGTPYFFHQLSAKEMEIRSAGPDRKMWTDDDRQAR
ncbi:hypothetical protein ACXR0O_27575 [Verrucomicrobiota bacterium sgz303538]